jgi:hypothetical protein
MSKKYIKNLNLPQKYIGLPKNFIFYQTYDFDF